MEYDDAVAVLTAAPADRMALLGALRSVPDMRARLDALERAVVDAARDAGASWAELAGALGLHSRQAAEQRRLRLGAATAGDPAGRDPDAERRRRQRERAADQRAGALVSELRQAARDALAGIDLDPDWPRTGPAALARHTLALAAVADPGPLVDLARLAAADLAGCALRPALAAAVHRLAELI